MAEVLQASESTAQALLLFICQGTRYPKAVSTYGSLPGFDAGPLDDRVQGALHILLAHAACQQPCDDVTAVIVGDGRKVVPSLSAHLEISEIRLPKLVDTLRF